MALDTMQPYKLKIDLSGQSALKSKCQLVGTHDKCLVPLLLFFFPFATINESALVVNFLNWLTIFGFVIACDNSFLAILQWGGLSLLLPNCVTINF